MTQAVVQLLAKHFLVVAVLLAGSLLVRNRSAAFRNSYWLIGFTWVLLLPLLVAGVPHWSVERTVPYSMPDQHPTVYAKNTRRQLSAQQNTNPIDPLAVIEDSKNPAVPAVMTTPIGNRDAGPILLAVYGIGVLICLAGLAESLLSIAKVRRGSAMADPEALAELASAAKAVGLRCIPDLLVNPDVTVPMTFWMGRSVVVAPSNDVSRAVLLHECAHIRRGDWFAQVFARIVRSLFWFDPILLFAERQMRAASEQAADDIVVSAGIEPVQYAEELFTIATHAGRQKFDAGLAIIGGSDLKSRVGQILRIGPRVVRLPFRWTAITMLLGALTVIPFAAFHYIRTELPASDSGFIDFGNGYWIRLLAITEWRGKNAYSWNMRGQLLPRPISDDFISPVSGQGKRVLVFASNIDDSSEFKVDSTNALELRLDNILGTSTWSYPAESIANGTLWTVGVPLNWPRDGELRLTTPTQSFSSPIASATYRNGHLVGGLNKSLFPTILKHGSFDDVPVPAGVTGQVELVWGVDKPGDHGSQTVDAGSGESFRVGSQDAVPPVLSLTMRSRPASRQFLITNIPGQPLTANIMPAIPPGGIVFHDAARASYTFADGEVLSLEAVSRTSGRKPLSWLAEGALRRTPASVRVDGDNSVRDDSVDEVYTSRTNSDAVRTLSFVISGSLSTMRNQALSLFNAAGFRADRGGDTQVETAGTSSNLPVVISDPSKPQDFVVRIADGTRRTSTHMPLEDAYRERHTKPATNYSYQGKSLIDFVVTRRLKMADVKSDPTHEVTIHLLDAHGKTIEASTTMTDGQVDQFIIDKHDLPKIRRVEIVTMPYIYIRFPKVAMNAAH